MPTDVDHNDLKNKVRDHADTFTRAHCGGLDACLPCFVVASFGLNRGASSRR
ncbi:hypothetical protein [Piscinibacter koreensis]|uniref:Uncharacterized protein n=1 Tax=Piscinibacter koreensis TaxID=2742824 RepID=A0A7Y6TY06_9BURK|nr:hypothetical protein [Schlegelella koreensis]NUZ07699.1 hypothetical protein [Schlegelella koreensis]